MRNGRILVIAGSDSSGGAGLEADQKVIASHRCYAMTATTALTAQSTLGVFDIHHVPTPFVEKQIDACISDIGVDVVKIGMLASRDTVKAVAAAMRRHSIRKIVLDPVMVATSGARLLPLQAMESLKRELLPLATVLTPNIPEALLLLKDEPVAAKEPQNVDDLVALAKAVQGLGPQYVLLKGGHLSLQDDRLHTSSDHMRPTVVDVLHGHDQSVVIRTDRIKSKNTHGTGCSLASAVACGLAHEHKVEKAVRNANAYVQSGIKTSLDLGQGSGPINHFHSSYTLPFSPGHFIDYLLEHTDVKPIWTMHTFHPFLKGLADGTLDIGVFRTYLIQDYLFLIQYMRANALAASKAKNVNAVGKSASVVAQIANEMKLHLQYCEEMGLTAEEVEGHEESQACIAYTRYILDIGQSEDWFALQVALAPCLLGYAEIAERLYNDTSTMREGNPYWKWIRTYMDEEYRQAVLTGRDLLEEHAMHQSTKRIEELVRIFACATRMEVGFWDMALMLPTQGHPS